MYSLDAVGKWAESNGIPVDAVCGLLKLLAVAKTGCSQNDQCKMFAILSNAFYSRDRGNTIAAKLASILLTSYAVGVVRDE